MEVWEGGGQTLVAVQLGKGDPAAAREVTDRLLQVWKCGSVEVWEGGQTLVAVQLGKGDPAAAREVTDPVFLIWEKF